MRFKLTLQLNKHTYGDLLPLNYQYECSSVIYKILSKSDKEYSEWLHTNGFQLENGKQFKLFTFSRLQVPQFRILGENMKILSDKIVWYISFLPEKSTQEFIQGIFKEQTFEIGNKHTRIHFTVNSIEVLPDPVYSQSMKFVTLSPICIPYKRSDGSFEYVSLEHPHAPELIIMNLLNKYKAFTGNDFPIDNFPLEITTISKAKATLITIKAGTIQETKIKGYLCSFEINAPIEMIKLMYTSGLGGKNSIGFGMIEVNNLTNYYYDRRN